MQGPPPSTAALPFQGEPRLSLERYASIYGTLQRTPNARPHVLQRLGWTEQELQAEELAWRSRLQKRPGLLGAFLQAAGRPEPGGSPGDNSR